nr:probable 18S rRNA (guanine-N(7))-methyltransferase [Hydra vulgaris]
MIPTQLFQHVTAGNLQNVLCKVRGGKAVFQFYRDSPDQVRGGKAVFQFYRDSPDQVELITLQTMKSGFTEGVVVDYPNSSRAKKMFLCLFAGVNMTKLPQALGTDDSSTTIDYTNSRQSSKFTIGKPAKKSKAWIVQKKDKRKRQGRCES